MKAIKNMLRDIERNRRLHEDADFMAEAEAATRLQARWSANALLYVILLLFTAFILWASFAEVDQITRGQGQVVPSADVQMIQSLEGGILSELNVEEGAAVKKGQVLARVRNVAFASERKGIESKAAALRLKLERLKAEASGQAYTPSAEDSAKYPDMTANEQALYTARQNDLRDALSLLNDRISQAQGDMGEIQAQMTRLSESSALLQKQMTMTKAMVDKNAAPQMDLIRMEREMADMRGNLAAAQQKRSSLAASLNVTRRERMEQENKFKSDALTQIAEVQSELSALNETLNAAADRVERSELKSPVDGVVKSIHLKTRGGVIEPAKVLMEIVPTDDQLKVTAKVSPTDIAFLKIGQEVKVKITAYDAQKYGHLLGRLTRIGADTVTDSKGNIFFEIDVVTDKNHLGTEAAPLPIMPGMVAQADVITGRHTIMEYLMKPFLRARQEALTER